MRLLAAVSALSGGISACVGAGNTFDNPNRSDPPARQRISLWKVEDTANGTLLASGCVEDGTAAIPSVSAAAGQKLSFEVRVWAVEKTSADSTPGFWCSDEDVVSKAMVSSVENLACWDFPDSDGIKLLGWEAIQTPRVVEPGAEHLMAGTGYRMQLEVEHPGSLHFVPNGACSVGGRVALEVRGPA